MRGPNTTRDTLSRSEILARAREATALMVFMPDAIDADFLEQCPKLHVIAGALKGCDNFDIEACTRRGIWFTIVPDLLTIPTAKLAIGLLLGITRNIAAGDRSIRNRPFRGWRPELYGTGLTGKTIGYIAMGAVGRAIASRMSSFDAEGLYCDPIQLPTEIEEQWRLRRVDLNELLVRSDHIIISAIDAGDEASN